MRIIAYIQKDSGVSYHRIIAPLGLMPDVDIFLTNIPLPEHFDKGCDVFMYNRVLPDHFMPALAELKKKHGFATCLDVDDFWHLNPEHVLYEDYIENNYAKQQIDHIIKADVVFTTHNRLAQEIEVFNPNVHVLPNAIPKQGQFDIERKNSELVRLFWQGSPTHREDVGLLAYAIARLNDISKKIEMIMAGFIPNELVWDQMASDYTAGGHHQYRLITATKVAKYYAAYQDADICLVPLVNNAFNRNKSNLKVLEAANLGLPVIASNVHPYLDMPLLYCRNSRDWEVHIRRLVASSKRRQAAGETLREFCDKEYNFKKINKERKQILEYQMSKV